MNIGFFGGSFNPIHNGHLDIARRVLAATDIDEVWFVVSPQNPFKDHSSLMADSRRMELTRRAVEGEKGLVASDCELQMPLPSYTWRTLQMLSERYPQHQFTLLIGADNWHNFSRWYHHDDILAHHKIVIYPRKGYPVDPRELPEGVTFVDMELYDISSTQIRQLLAEGHSVSHLVPPAISDILQPL